MCVRLSFERGESLISSGRRRVGFQTDIKQEAGYMYVKNAKMVNK